MEWGVLGGLSVGVEMKVLRWFEHVGEMVEGRLVKMVMNEEASGRGDRVCVMNAKASGRGDRVC